MQLSSYECHISHRDNATCVRTNVFDETRPECYGFEYYSVYVYTVVRMLCQNNAACVHCFREINTQRADGSSYFIIYATECPQYAHTN